MPSDQLRAELAQLHSLLQDTQEIDDSTRQSLTQLAEDIQRVLQAPSDRTDQGHTDLRHRIDDVVLDFEAKHPQLTQILSRVTDLLSNMGI